MIPNIHDYDYNHKSFTNESNFGIFILNPWGVDIAIQSNEPWHTLTISHWFGMAVYGTVNCCKFIYNKPKMLFNIILDIYDL